AITEHDLTVASVLSGNRNFEGRIHPLVKANYLASAPLVVAYALTGTVDVDLTKEPLGSDSEGNDIYLQDICPAVEECKNEDDENVFNSKACWNQIQTTEEPLFEWDSNSTYIQNPPFFENLSREPDTIKPLKNLRAIGKFGDSVTTDHISPAGAIAKDMPAGK